MSADFAKRATYVRGIPFRDRQPEVVEARILLGIHFRFPDTEGRKLGARVAF